MDTKDLPPWEPPIAGAEAEHLTAALDRLRTTFRWKAGGTPTCSGRPLTASSARIHRQTGVPDRPGD